MKRVLLSALVLLLIPFQASAALPSELPFHSYVFNRYDRAVPVPSSYMPLLALSGLDLGIGALSSPQDMAVGPCGSLFVADTGNRRIVILDDNFNLVQVIDEFIMNGELFEFLQPVSLFVTKDGRIHVADPELRLVVTVDRGGIVQMVLGSPESEMLSENFHFTPISVIEDATGVMYILSRGSYQGALMIDLVRDNLFLGFYGANQVQMNVTQVGQMIWRRIFTREQRERMIQIIPVEFTNFDICPNGFIYVASAFSENNVNQLRVLNSAGDNILRLPQITDTNFNYGDPIHWSTRFVQVTSSFIDIAYMGNGLFAALDRTRGRIFIYNMDSHLITAFGQLGDQFGQLGSPAAIVSFGDQLVVLDSLNGELTIFGLTEYGRLIQEALVLHDQGRYAESVDLWRAVQNRSVNFELAYLGIGRGLARSGQLRESLWYLRRANNAQAYSEAFDFYRTEFVREHFNTLALVFVLLFLGFLAISNRALISSLAFGKNAKKTEALHVRH